MPCSHISTHVKQGGRYRLLVRIEIHMLTQASFERRVIGSRSDGPKRDISSPLLVPSSLTQGEEGNGGSEEARSLVV